jgi:hypothetical protein
MNRTIKETTLKRNYFGNQNQLRSHLADFIIAYNYARRLKPLRGLTPYEYIIKCWIEEPDRFKLDPSHQLPVLNN